MSKINSYKIAIIGLVILMVGLFAFLLSSISKHKLSNRTTNLRLQIVTSFYPIYFFTTQIVQNKADVHNITPAGAEPHDYEPTSRDMAKIENSDILIINGGKFEGWSENIKNILNGQNSTILNISENLLAQNIGGSDPHFWLDPVLAKNEVDIITKKLIEKDPVNFQFYSDNSKILIKKLDNLNNEFILGLANCKNREIITSHSAFGYLAHEYGLNQTSVSGLSPDEEPSPKKIAEIAKYARDNKVQYIFFESLVSPKLAETIAQEIRAKTLVLNPIEGITEKEIVDGKNYFTEMQQNLINLKIALQCQ